MVFNEIPMKFPPPPPPPKKRLYVERLNKLNSLSPNPNVPEECFNDFENGGVLEKEHNG